MFEINMDPVHRFTKAAIRQGVCYLEQTRQERMF